MISYFIIKYIAEQFKEDSNEFDRALIITIFIVLLPIAFGTDLILFGYEFIFLIVYLILKTKCKHK